MSTRRGRPRTRGRGRATPIPDAASEAVPEASEGSSSDLRQGMAAMHGTLAGILQAINRLADNQPRQEHREAEEPIGVQGAGSSDGGQLLKNFMALRPPEFTGGTDVAVAENWMLSIEKHLRSMGCTDAQKVQLGTFLLRDDAERWWEIVR